MLHRCRASLNRVKLYAAARAPAAPIVAPSASDAQERADVETIAREDSAMLLGGAAPTSAAAVVGDAATGAAPAASAACGVAPSLPRAVRPMLSEARRRSLENMYELVGTHSAVKLCRWTKSMLRGRGGCYKSSCYNIASHRCMEATPSLGCANKCTFCWRGTAHPTIKTWNFETDEPKALVAAMLDAHRGLIHSQGGLPGATPERLAEAKAPRHCALSLVGEPIAYPRISEFVDELHARGISSFLVMNGQFVEQLRRCRPVTQLYLSVDAFDKKTMRELDRPAFPDFWERHQASVAALAARRERTVFRLTLIEGINMSDDDIGKLVAMVRVGRPGLLELKQLTPAFQGRTTPLRMSNVPSLARIFDFANKLVDALGRDDWDVPVVHEHSSLLLVAQKSRYLVNGKWWTWIDFDRHIELAKRDPDAATWTWADYMCPTADWALVPPSAGGLRRELLGSLPGLGFDPLQTRRLSTKAKKARGIATDDDADEVDGNASVTASSASKRASAT
jgi:tRNA wybutosine-synthesizing protein 1